MKRALLSIAALLVAVVSGVMFVGGQRADAAATILVGDPFATSDGVYPYVCGDVVNPCDTIQHGIDTAAPGDIVDVASGPWSENVVVNKRLTLRGAGSAPFQTVITSAATNTPVITIDGDLATGLSAVDRVVIQDLRVTGASGGSGDSNSGIRVTGAGTTEFLTFDNVAAVSNSGNGIAFSNTGTVNDVEVTDSDLSNNGNAGLRIPTSITTFNGLDVNGGTIDNNAINGIQTGASGSPNVDNVTIEGVSFTGNGTATSGGDGDISLFKYNGDALIKDVTIAADSHIGIQVRGSDTYAPSGTVTLDNVSITGSPRFGMSIIGFTDVSGFSFNDVSINATGNYNLYLETLSTQLDIGDTVLGPSAVVASIANVSTGAVDATGATFTGAGNNFDIEDRVLHGVDAPGGGVVTWVANNLYVSTNSFVPPLTLTPSIQRGIDAATAGNVVNVEAGTWNAPVVVNKSVTLSGAQAGVAPTPGCAPGSQTIQRRSIDVAANNVVIDGFTVAEVGSNGVAPGPVGPANPDVLGTGIYLRPTFSGYAVRNNVIRDNIFGVYYNSSGVLPSIVERNCFISNNEPGAASGDGIYSDQGLSNASMNANRFVGHDSAAIVLAGTQSDIDIDANTLASDRTIVLFNTDNATITNNTSTTGLSGSSTIFLGGGNDGVQISGNTVIDAPATAIRILDAGFGANSNVAISGNTLDGNASSSAFGVRVGAGAISSGLSITNNPVIRDHLRGIEIDGANGAIVTGNGISSFNGPSASNPSAIQVINSTGIDVSSNTINGGNVGSCIGGFWGIFLQDASGDVDTNVISGIGNGLTTGCQEGRAIEAKGAGTVSLQGNVIGTYQKSGIIIRDTVNSTITGNTLNGSGPSNIIAMNGITVVSTGTATIDGNQTNGHHYLPEPTASCGILTFNTVTISNNSSTLDEVGICAIGGTDSLITENSIVRHRQQGILLDGATSAEVSENSIDGQGSGTTANSGCSPTCNPDNDTRYYGIFVLDSTGEISGNTIKGITHGPANGTQSGVGIRASARAGASTDVDITGNSISDYQKNGVVITNFYGGTAVNADVSLNSVAGSGPVNYIAQNGVQISDGATATIVDNEISDHDYTPFTAAAVGVLLISAGNVTVDGNNIHDNMEGMYVQQTDDAVITDNTFVDNYDASIFTYLSSDGVYSGNQVFGQTGSYGMYFYDDSSNNSVTGNAFRDHEYGLVLDYTGPSAPLTNAFNNNCIAGNVTAGMYLEGALVGSAVNAENNWWGKTNGPNPPGLGDVITPAGDIDASPFLTSPTAGCPLPVDADGDGINNPQDNCVSVYNPGQENTNGEPMLLPKPTPVYDDATNPAADADGDACDNDIDGDGVANGMETSMFLSPLVWDTDGDRTNDGTEVACGSSPISPISNLTGTDSDNDQLPDSCEAVYGSNPALADTDGDGVIDGIEVRYWMSSPLSVNTDGDDCTDGREMASVNADRKVSSIDLSQLAQYFGALPPEFRPFDVNGDGKISSIDLSLTAQRFGNCTPT